MPPLPISRTLRPTRPSLTFPVFPIPPPQNAFPLYFRFVPKFSLVTAIFASKEALRRLKPLSSAPPDSVCQACYSRTDSASFSCTSLDARATPRRSSSLRNGAHWVKTCCERRSTHGGV
eukprot:20294-Pleurochrysis_carterae.AAC.4